MCVYMCVYIYIYIYTPEVGRVVRYVRIRNECRVVQHILAKSGMSCIIRYAIML